MRALTEYLFGYYTVRVDARELPSVADRCLRAGVRARVRAGGELRIPLRDRDACRVCLADVVADVGPPMGLPGAMRRCVRHMGVLVGVLILLLLSALGERVVWDVRVLGDASVDPLAVLAELQQAGLYSGALWQQVDVDRTETAIVASSDTVGWISIDRRGQVGYVTVLGRHVHEDPSPPVGFANVIACEDALIDEILVTRGEVTVTVGETVRAGELLISGALLPELGGGFCYAEGVVMGRVTHELCVEISPTRLTEHTERIGTAGAEVNFFGFCINILKNYRNSFDECDIMEETRSVRLLGAYPLPIRVRSFHRVRRYTVEERLDAEQMVRRAELLLSERIRTTVGDGELLALRTEGEFVGDVYRMTAYVTYRTSIGQTDVFYGTDPAE